MDGELPIQKSDKYAGFLAAASELDVEEELRKPKQKKRARPAGFDAEADFEQAPRNSHPEWSRGVSGRLPLKLPDGTFASAGVRPVQKRSTDDTEQVDDAQESGSADENESADGDDSDLEHTAAAQKTKKKQPNDVSSFAQLAALPAKAASERRNRLTAQIAQFSERIVSDPEHNVAAASARAVAVARQYAHAGKNGKSGEEDAPGLKRNTLLGLHQLGADPDPLIRKLALLSLTTVYKDILPGYRIRLPTAAELSAPVSKDVRKLRDYESALLKGYQRFLRLLEHTVAMGEQAANRVRRRESAGAKDAGAHVHVEGSTAAAFESDAQDDEGGSDVDDEEGGGGRGRKKGGGKEHGISAKAYQQAKMAEKRADKAQRDGLGPYDADDASKVVLGRTALSCLGGLLGGLPHFNYRANLAAFLVPRMSSKDEELSTIACDAVAQAFANDSSFECALEITRALAEESKRSTSGRGAPILRAKALQTLMKLRLTDLEKLDSLNRDAKAHASSRAGQAERTKERQMAKKAAKLAKYASGKDGKGGGGSGTEDLQDVLAGLKAADAENLAERKKHAEATLKRVISIYFRVLRTPSHAYLLPDALTGLARFAHLIDVGVVSDLLVCLRETLSSGLGQDKEGQGDGDGEREGQAGRQGKGAGKAKLSLPAALNSVLTALRIMAGPGSILNADDTQFAHYLYSTLLRLSAPGGGQHGLTAVYAVQALLVNRREYSGDRVAAFVKRCLTVSLSLPVPSCLAMLSLVRAISHRYPQVRGMFAAHAATGSAPSVGGAAAGSVPSASSAIARDISVAVAHEVQSAMSNPDRAGAALQAVGWEIAALAQHWHPSVRAAAAACASGKPLLPSDAPHTIAREHAEDSGLFNPPVAMPKTAPGTVQGQGQGQGAAGQGAAGQGQGKEATKIRWGPVIHGAEPTVLAGIPVPPAPVEAEEQERVGDALKELCAVKTGRLMARAQLFMSCAAAEARKQHSTGQ